ncbi:MAG TPA: replication protein RepA [Bryobacteraceae bacterium]|nr:replication protein RepA [Bryobacteraceae bacterium]
MPKDLTPVGAILPAIIKPEHKPLSRIQERLLSLPLPSDDEDAAILYQHSVLCQTCMPYRNPGEEVRAWQRSNGRVSLRIQAGNAYDANKDAWLDVGLPHGPKPRLVLYHLNAEALRTQSPLLELEDSLTAFVKRTLGLDPGGRTIRTVKDQLTRLASADFRFGMGQDGRSVTIKGSVIDGFELWTPKDDKQRVLWPTTVQFSPTYFNSLMQHAVPLNEGAVARLSHSAMALDVYTWLAQRLHRVDPKKAGFIPWVSMKAQFGHDYGRMVDFRRVFTRTLKLVKAVYREARFSLDGQGMRVYNSPPPVARRLLQIK